MPRSPDRKPDPESWLLRRQEVLQRLQVSTSTLNREIAAGRFPKGIYVGRSKRWRLSWLEDYLDHLESET